MNYIITEETLLLQKRAGIITESQYREKIKEVELALKKEKEEKEALANASQTQNITIG